MRTTAGPRRTNLVLTRCIGLLRVASGGRRTRREAKECADDESIRDDKAKKRREKYHTRIKSPKTTPNLVIFEMETPSTGVWTVHPSLIPHGTINRLVFNGAMESHLKLWSKRDEHFDIFAQGSSWWKRELDESILPVLFRCQSLGSSRGLDGVSEDAWYHYFCQFHTVSYLDLATLKRRGNKNGHVFDGFPPRSAAQPSTSPPSLHHQAPRTSAKSRPYTTVPRARTPKARGRRPPRALPSGTLTLWFAVLPRQAAQKPAGEPQRGATKASSAWRFRQAWLASAEGFLAHLACAWLLLDVLMLRTHSASPVSILEGSPVLAMDPR
ncbi:hypothetical protein FDECE_16084 [Fusarium decemcellulare]|nr:hypothetical protein FDECE_16084 [Fusarium decemcellulare]